MAELFSYHLFHEEKEKKINKPFKFQGLLEQTILNQQTK
jgi:hypothetical protein